MREQGEGICLTINNQAVTVEAGTTIKEAAATMGLKIPDLCHLPGRREADEPCLICMVEADGELARACRTEVTAGMVVNTATRWSRNIGGNGSNICSLFITAIARRLVI